MVLPSIILAVSLSTNSSGIQGAPSGYSVPPPQDATYGRYSVQRFPCVFVVAADDDGSFTHTSDDGRGNRLETAADCARIVADINRAYAPAGIQLDFGAWSYVRRNRTALNRQFFSPLSGGPMPSEEELRDRSKKPPTPRSEEYRLAREALKNEFPNRVVFLFMSDSQWAWDNAKGRWGVTTTSGGWSGRDGVNCICGTNAPVCIHELGHHFGLGHTFGAQPDRAQFEAEIGKALAEGRTLDQALAAYDGDGVPDTGPDPGRRAFEQGGHKVFSAAPAEFTVPSPNGAGRRIALRPGALYNWMSYYRETRQPHPATGRVEGRFSRMQCMRMYNEASQRPWQPVFVAMDRGELGRVRELAASVLAEHKDGTAQLYGRVVEGWLTPRSGQTPAQAVPSVTEVFLSDRKESLATVGWGQPSFNRGPADGTHSSFLTVGDHVYAKGIQAHAPSRIVYDLGGAWGTFSTKVGVMDHVRFEGSVRFRIVGDGKVIAESPVLRALQAYDFTVSVKGVRQLALETDDGGDGRVSDWAAWLDPRLTRG